MSRLAVASVPAVTPSATFAHPAPQLSGSIFAMFPARLVSSSQSSCGVASISAQRSDRHSEGTALSNTSARDAQNTLCRRPCSAAKASAAAFHRCGARQYADAVRFRGAFGPQFVPLCQRRFCASA